MNRKVDLSQRALREIDNIMESETLCIRVANCNYETTVWHIYLAFVV